MRNESSRLSLGENLGSQGGSRGGALPPPWLTSFTDSKAVDRSRVWAVVVFQTGENRGRVGEGGEGGVPWGSSLSPPPHGAEVLPTLKGSEVLWK